MSLGLGLWLPRLCCLLRVEHLSSPLPNIRLMEKKIEFENQENRNQKQLTNAIISTKNRREND